MRLYYPDDYGPYLHTAVEQTRVWQVLRCLVDCLDTATPVLPPGRLIELGTASGNYLLKMQKDGWVVTGVEIDPKSAKTAAVRTGASVVCGDVESVDFPEGSANLVCAWMVFEHLYDPVEAFRRCYRWLRPGGWLSFSVPECSGWQFRLFRAEWYSAELPRHLYHFTAPILKSILPACGFTDIQVMWQRTLFDVVMSVAYALESRGDQSVGRLARSLANSVPARAVSRALGVFAGPLRLTGRLTVWARKPPG